MHFFGIFDQIRNKDMATTKSYCVGDVTTCRIVGRYATAEEAAVRTTANPRDLLAFHEAHKANLGMTEGDEPDLTDPGLDVP